VQEAEIAGRVITLPECHEGDVEWLAAVLYAMKTRNFDAGINILEVQRYSIMRRYESIYREELEANGEDRGPSIARRAANNFLRQKISNYKNMMHCITFAPDLIK
jgi:hypothetical protein